LRPGRILTWQALTSSSPKPASSRTYQTGFQYWPVASIATWEARRRDELASTLLAVREGPLLEQAVGALPIAPEVLVVNATGRDHPRRAGLALHLGAVLGLPTVGVTTRPLVAQGGWPADQRGATAPLRLGGEVVGCWVRTRAGAKPVAVHAAWQTEVQAAVQVVLAATRRARTPEPLRRARTLARTRRAQSR